MRIACVAWGSLVWDPRDLLIRRPWFNDGPLLPIEFCRQSSDGRITLVITPGHPCVRTLWALFSVDDLDGAVESLRSREGIPAKNSDLHIGRWANNKPQNQIEVEIASWARKKRIDAVVWTALPPKFDGKDDVTPCAEEIVAYLKRLPFEKKRHAEQYVRKAPIQIDTDYRRKIQDDIGWTPS